MTKQKLLPTIPEIIAGGLIEPIVFATVTILALTIYIRMRHRFRFTRRLLPLRRWTISVLPPAARGLDITVAYALIPPRPAGVPYYMVEEGDVRCLYEIYSLLGDLYRRDAVRAISEHDLRPDIHNHPNVVIISGPVWNRTMELYLGLTGSPIRFEWDETDLRLLGPADKEYKTDYIGNHRVKRCHGVIVAATIETAGHTQNVVIVAGCSNLSTYAGASLLAQLDISKGLRRTVRRSKIQRDGRWAIVYRVENWGENDETNAPIPTMQYGALRLYMVDAFRSDQFVEPYEHWLERHDSVSA